MHFFYWKNWNWKILFSPSFVVLLYEAWYSSALSPHYLRTSSALGERMLPPSESESAAARQRKQASVALVLARLLIRW